MDTTTARDFANHDPIGFAILSSRIEQRVSEEEDVERIFRTDRDVPAPIVRDVFVHVGKVAHIEFEGVVRVQQIDIEAVPNHVVQCTT